MGIVLKNGNLIDGTGKVVKDAVVVIEGSTITAVGPAAEVRVSEGENQVVDVAGMTIMPGLIDLHVHLYGQAEPDKIYRTAEKRSLLEATEAYLAVVMAENARRTIEAGFTTIRDMGAPNDINIDISRVIEDGILKGPRVIPTATIGMSSIPGKRGTHGAAGLGYTGPVETKRAAREKVIGGAEVIHLIATGAQFGPFGPKVQILTVEEMRAAIEETHKLGKRTTANACSAEGARNAVIAGVQCIEHGEYLYEDNDSIRMMVDRGVGFVPTLIVVLAKVDAIREAEARGEKSGLPEYVEKRTLDELEPHRRSFEKAMEAGVLVPIGTDCGAPFTPSGTNAIEMEMFVKYGATEMEAIEAATRVAAEVMRMEERLGTVEAGKEADIIVVKEDPLRDIRVLQENENIVLVIKGGEIVVDRRDGSQT